MMNVWLYISVCHLGYRHRQRLLHPSPSDHQLRGALRWILRPRLKPRRFTFFLDTHIHAHNTQNKKRKGWPRCTALNAKGCLFLCLNVNMCWFVLFFFNLLQHLANLPRGRGLQRDSSCRVSSPTPTSGRKSTLQKWFSLVMMRMCARTQTRAHTLCVTLKSCIIAPGWKEKCKTVASKVPSCWEERRHLWMEEGERNEKEGGKWRGSGREIWRNDTRQEGGQDKRPVSAVGGLRHCWLTSPYLKLHYCCCGKQQREVSCIDFCFVTNDLCRQ